MDYFEGIENFATKMQLKKKKGFALVSVVIPAFNHEPYIQRSLDSVAEQDYPNKEIVVIDDGSNDATKEKIEAWVRNNETSMKIIFKAQENVGTAKTLNRLLDMARGDYIALSSSDDYLLPGSLSLRVEMLNKVNKKAVFGDCMVIDENDEYLHESSISGLYDGDKKLLQSNHHLPSQILRSFSIAGPAMLFHRSILSSLGNFDSSLLVEDWDFCLNLAVNNELAFLDHPVGVYRLHKSNTINRENSLTDSLSYEEKVYRKYKHCFRQDDLKFINRRLRRISFKKFKLRLRERFKSILEKLA